MEGFCWACHMYKRASLHRCSSALLSLRAQPKYRLWQPYFLLTTYILYACTTTSRTSHHAPLHLPVIRSCWRHATLGNRPVPPLLTPGPAPARARSSGGPRWRNMLSAALAPMMWSSWRHATPGNRPVHPPLTPGPAPARAQSFGGPRISTMRSCWREWI
ncbi:uncharacterized protein C8Q71DRAFT_389883 [Rhodofomes roseus]|uniref:Uncharacterized protein n=1 Tax=Rhodofomes roseus TaxID=34475 RepID=A0ABQ8K0X9_9APHY|nr:uncharacterized protein C8Q71DRAFT_389883 [Rhodofomes roseus]KAH9829834.1 hypothetical protein C8Q71DRAFT_389883 [Rhodofomes roseus]